MRRQESTLISKTNSRTALLLDCPPDRPDQELAGLTLLERNLFHLAKAGFGEASTLAPSSTLGSSGAPTGARNSAKGAAAVPCDARPKRLPKTLIWTEPGQLQTGTTLYVQSCEFLAAPEWLARQAERSLSGGRPILYLCAGQPFAALMPSGSEAAQQLLQGRGGPLRSAQGTMKHRWRGGPLRSAQGTMKHRWRGGWPGMEPALREEVPRSQCVPARNGSERAAALDWLFSRLMKDNEGFMSRHFERKISFRITRFLLPTPITPNQITLFSIGLGLLGAWWMAQPDLSWPLAGSVLFWLHSVVDGCDGELARLKFLESKWGGLLDFWGDNVVHCAVFAGIAAQAAQKTGGNIPWILAAAACLGILAATAWVSRNLLRKKEEGEGEPLFTGLKNSIQNRLAQRDFIYLVVLLAIFNRLEWFLWAGAIGSPLFFLVLTFTELSGGQNEK